MNIDVSTPTNRVLTEIQKNLLKQKDIEGGEWWN